MGISTSNLNGKNLRSSIRIVAPIAGYVSNIEVSQGKILGPDEVALLITNTDHLHVELMVFEKDVPHVKKGQKIKYKVAGVEQQVSGYVHLVSKSVDAEKRAINVHGHIDKSPVLKSLYPGMYVESEIVTASENKRAWPESCAVQIDNQYYVLVLTSQKNGTYAFVKKYVEVLGRSNGNVHLKGVDTDAKLLDKGAFDLITE
jgi:cobalt-zinc-cadmium efflux system membrane fusion protein